VCSPEVEEELAALEARGKSVMVVCRDDGQAVLGVLGVADVARETSVEAIRDLHALGVSS
jgi:Cd2+/Zn2+-exporting ATPase